MCPSFTLQTFTSLLSTACNNKPVQISSLNTNEEMKGVSQFSFSWVSCQETTSVDNMKCLPLPMNKYFNRKSNRQWCGTLWPCINKSTSWEISSMGAIYIWFLAHSGMLKSYFYLMEIPFTRVLSIGSRFSILIVGISSQHIL